MFAKIKGAEVYGISYPKENLAKLFNCAFQELEKNGRVVSHIYMSEMMIKFAEESIKGSSITKSNGKKYLWSALIHPSKRCYDVYFSDELLNDEIWDNFKENKQNNTD